MLCPMMQFYIAPWRVLSEENYQIVKDYTDLREKFVPYIMELVEKAARDGGPIVRYLEYQLDTLHVLESIALKKESSIGEAENEYDI